MFPIRILIGRQFNHATRYSRFFGECDEVTIRYTRFFFAKFIYQFTRKFDSVTVLAKKKSNRASSRMRLGTLLFSDLEKKKRKEWKKKQKKN